MARFRGERLGDVTGDVRSADAGAGRGVVKSDVVDVLVGSVDREVGVVPPLLSVAPAGGGTAGCAGPPHDISSVRCAGAMEKASRTGSVVGGEALTRMLIDDCC